MWQPIIVSVVLAVLSAIIHALHLLEISAWAGLYFWRNYLPDFETSFYFSITSYTTVGYGGIVLPRPWRLAGALESLSGVLLLGWSAAFFFSVVSRLFNLRIRRRQETTLSPPQAAESKSK